MSSVLLKDGFPSSNTSISELAVQSQRTRRRGVLQLDNCDSQAAGHRDPRHGNLSYPQSGARSARDGQQRVPGQRVLPMAHPRFTCGSSISAFSFQPADVFDLAQRILGVTQRTLVERALGLFVTSASQPILVDHVNMMFGTSIAHPTSSSTDPLGRARRDRPSRGNRRAGGAVFVVYLFDASSDDSTRANISTFFEGFFDGGSIENYIRQLLVPKIDARLELGLALEFPRNVLEPLDAIGGEPLDQHGNQDLADV